MDQAFAGTTFAEDPEADPEAVFVEMWFADLGIPLVARNLLTDDTVRRMARHVEAWEEPILVIATGSHSITGEDFVRNSVPDRLALHQGGFPLNLRDAAVDLELKPGHPAFAEGLILRADTRLGFDPAAPWSLGLRLVRRHPYMGSESAARDFPADYRPPVALFDLPRIETPAPPWLSSWTGRAGEIAALLLFLAGLGTVLGRRRGVKPEFTGRPPKPPATAAAAG